MENQNDIITRINEKFGTMSKSHKAIAAFITDHYDQAVLMTAAKLGKSNLEIAWKHMVPHLLPQFLVGLILLFPHAILHEASITFLGFGLSPEQPAIGIILEESMTHLAMGRWWLAVFPGLLLVMTVVLFDVAGESLRKLLDPASAHK